LHQENFLPNYNPLYYIRLILQSRAALRYAQTRGLPGMEFARYGQKIGITLLLKGQRGGFSTLVHPVSITRYFEFPFAFSCLPDSAEKCLDVSSPRLFSLYVAAKQRVDSIKIINPDANDIQQTERFIKALTYNQIDLTRADVASLQHRKQTYDLIWSLSVIEHIAGEYDDTFAVQLMYDLLKPGGRLIITVPVDRKHWDEYRDSKYYEPQTILKKNRYFFQRFYDADSIRTRIFEPVGQQPAVIRWFGETTSGRFQAYIERWLRYGQEVTINDPLEVSNYYQEFESWEEMPGVGVCGFMIEKSCETKH
jgi:SAM-dependent methyltransferase